jgi:biopolymer transport protein ExbB
MFDGGPLMVPLLACSILTLAVLVDRLWVFLQNAKYDTRSLRAKVLDLMGDGRVDDAARLCASTPNPVSAVLLTGLQSYAKHKDLVDRPEALTAVMDKAMDDYSLHAMSAVEKRFAILATIGSAAPLLGFTGTVTGMIRSFAEMAGANDPRVVASGISEALITTAAGLLIALAAVIPYNVFLGMANKIDLEIEEAKSEILDFIATRARAR